MFGMVLALTADVRRKAVVKITIIEPKGQLVLDRKLVSL